MGAINSPWVVEVSIVTTTAAAGVGTIDDPEVVEVSTMPVGVDSIDDPGVVEVSRTIDDLEVVEVSTMPVGVDSIDDPGVVEVSRCPAGLHCPCICTWAFVRLRAMEASSTAPEAFCLRL